VLRGGRDLSWKVEIRLKYIEGARERPVAQARFSFPKRHEPSSGSVRHPIWELKYTQTERGKELAVRVGRGLLESEREIGSLRLRKGEPKMVASLGKWMVAKRSAVRFHDFVA